MFFRVVAATVFGTLFALYLLYIPLPDDISNRNKMQVAEFCLRMFYLYPMNLLGHLNPHVQLWWARTSLHNMVALLNPFTNHDPTLQITDEIFNGVPVRLYRPRNLRRNAPGLVFIHGGGFVLLNAGSYDSTVREIARLSRMVVISIDYRLAPEHPFPSSILDCINATIHFHRNAARWGVDPKRIGVVGDSAGGNLATVTARKLRELHGLRVKAQALIYPLLQYSDFKTPSYQLYKSYAGASLPDPPSIARWMLLYLGLDHRLASIVESNGHVAETTLSQAVMRHMNHMKLPRDFHHEHYEPTNHTIGPVGGDLTGDYRRLQSLLLNPDFAPLMHPDLSQAPITYIATTEYDILRDEGYWYAQRIRAESGIRVRYKHYKAAFHGVLNFYRDVDVAKQMVDDLVYFLAEVL